MTEKVAVGPCTPLLIVSDIPRSLAHYVDQLGFECRFEAPARDPFLAIVGRSSAQIMLKAVGVPPLSNHQRHAWARWDLFIHTPDPDALAEEFARREVRLHRPLGDDDDGLRGFETIDPDGYVCFFGRPG